MSRPMETDFFKSLCHDDFANGAITDDIYAALKERDKLKAELDDALKTAEIYRSDWMAAKHEFGKRVKQLMAERDALREACELVLLFHSGGAWDGMKVARWSGITDHKECTTKVMCDHIRKVLSTPQAEEEA